MSDLKINTISAGGLSAKTAAGIMAAVSAADGRSADDLCFTAISCISPVESGESTGLSLTRNRITNIGRAVMKRYQVTVDGEIFKVDVAEVAALPAPVPPPDLPPIPASAELGDNRTVKSPLPGVVACVNVEAGQVVKAGDVLLVLEAMKMENDVIAFCDGVVSAVCVEAGATVQSGDVLVVL
ncbi:MAG: biotin/lipoyl-binding protein [Oscillospiraceae bacterium]|nr:biotin/lipoyl-binding protein [Oscillospiraceae bacterium]